LLLLASLAGAAQARNYEDNYASKDCYARQYECGCNPLYCGSWDLQIQGGVSPILWRDRGPISGVNFNAETQACATEKLFASTPRFNALHKVPWIVGGQIGYALSDNARVYSEFNYSQAHGKNAVAVNSDLAAPSSVFTFSVNKYKFFDGYVGARYYFDRWCDSISFFCGGKVGFTHHKKQNADLVLAFATLEQTLVLTPGAVLNNSETVVAGGGHIGLDYCICDNWSLALTGEVVASCGPRTIDFIALPNNPTNFTNLIFGGIGTELRFPVTVALRYSF